jgi:hypothetical protein
VEERDLEWSRAEFCGKSLDTSQRPAIPMLTTVVKTVITANLSRVRGYTARVQKCTMLPADCRPPAREFDSRLGPYAPE